MDPDSYTSMAQVRAGVDEIDRQLVALLDLRFAHMRAAARIKPDRGAVRGDIEGGVASWKGIPFAAPPVGPLR